VTIPTMAVLGSILVSLAAFILLIILLRRRTPGDAVDLRPRLESIEKGQERAGRELREELSRNREEAASQSRSTRVETAATLKDVNDSLLRQINAMMSQQTLQQDGFKGQLTRLTDSNEQKIDALRIAVETKLTQLQADNTAKLEEMRRTVDEKLQGTLERRLGESFKLVSERLEQVHKGLGDMQSLASGVGDLKKVLTNIKVRGNWGEMQLGNLLEDVLIPDQYGTNVVTKPGSKERVEFAIKLPGRGDHDDQVVWLPIDAKFPKEDYERLMDARERGDAAVLEDASRQLENRIKSEAKDIRDKYVDPPNTTDFAILYLSTEGLYAEVLSRPGLVAAVQRDFRVNVAGPTTLAALLNSLQMGFRTLAIAKRSSEVWSILGAVKTEFHKFGEVIDKVKKKIDEAGNVIDTAKTRSRAIERKLKNVQELPAGEARTLLDIAGTSTEDEESGGPEEPAPADDEKS
jgi:DNA recombination protein RmuC